MSFLFQVSSLEPQISQISRIVVTGCQSCLQPITHGLCSSVPYVL